MVEKKMTKRQMSREFKRLWALMSPEKQAKATLFIENMAKENWAESAIRNVSTELDWKQTVSRVKLVGRELELPESEIRTALKFQGRTARYLVAFASRYNQDLNWLFMGDVGSMCRKLAWAEGWRPAGWDANMERIAAKARRKSKANARRVFAGERTRGPKVKRATHSPVRRPRKAA